MRVPLEDFVPYERSVEWRVHDAYFANRGIAAWSEGEIPYFSTTNFALARQHADLLLAVAARQPGAPAPALLEIGGGQGQFAANLFRALDSCFGRKGRALAMRLTYVFSDAATSTVEQAARSPALRELIGAGRVVPAVLDVRSPTSLRALERGARLPRSFLVVVASYVCCVSPIKVLRRRGSEWEEKFVRASVDLPAREARRRDAVSRLITTQAGEGLLQRLDVETEWRRIDLESALGDRRHARVLARATRDLTRLTAAYPRVFLDAVVALVRRLSPGGVVVVNDFGAGGGLAADTSEDHGANVYGDSLNHAVQFGWFDAFFAEARLGLERTRDLPRALQTAIVSRSREVPPSVARAFRRSFVLSHGNEDLLDFRRAASDLLERGEFARAARFFARCAALDPVSSDPLVGAAKACLGVGAPEGALEYLSRARLLPDVSRKEVDCLAGHAWARLRDWRAAARAYESSVEHGETPEAWLGLGRARLELDDRAGARRAFARALELRPDHPDAVQCLQRLEEGQDPHGS